MNIFVKMQKITLKYILYATYEVYTGSMGIELSVGFATAVLDRNVR